MNNASAASESALADLISLWQRRRAEGRAATPAELCRDRPELLAELERRIAALERMDGLADAAGETVSVASADASPPSTSTTIPYAGRLDIPGFEVLSELGRGGMGVVYLAQDTQLKRPVALKMVLAGGHSSEDSRGRFRAEAEAIARLQHPHVVQIFSWGEHDGLPYLVMEHVARGGLDRRLGGRPQPPADAARVVMLLARAVQAAHKAGVVHRDLKPSNVLLAPDADEPALNSAYGWPKISDFGLARLSGGSGAQTASYDVLGTPSYMAPEQAAGKAREVGPTADVYSLGAILYELLTGCPPFKGESLLETLDQVRSRPPRPPSELCAGVPPALEAICLRCLAKASADRYPTAQALADDLRCFLAADASGGQERTEALPVRPRPLPERTTRSRRRAVLAIVVGVMALLALIPLVYWLQSSPAPQQTPAELAAVAPSPLKGWIDIRVWKGKDKPAGPGRRLREQGVLPLREGDWMRIDAETNRPAYLYVIWLDSEGKSTPMYPWRDNNWHDRPADERAVRRLAIPQREDKDAAPLEGSPSGVECILLFAREEPLRPGADEVLATLFRDLPSQERRSDLRTAAWFENGELVRDEEDRGPMQIGRAKAVDDPVLRTQRLLHSRLGELFSYSRAVCYGFQGK